MSRLELSMREQEHVTVIGLSGTADMRESSALNAYLETLFSRGRYHLILDLRDLQFITSMGLGSLIRAYTRCRDHQGRLVLVNPPAGIRKIFRTTRLEELFDMFETMDMAMAAMRRDERQKNDS